MRLFFTLEDLYDSPLCAAHSWHRRREAGIRAGTETDRSAKFLDTIKKCGQHPQPTSVTISEALWSDITQQDQDRVWKLLFGKKLGSRRLSWTTTIRELSVSQWIARLRYWSYFRRFVWNYLGDPIAYFPREAKYRAIHARISGELTRYQGRCHTKRRHSAKPSAVDRRSAQPRLGDFLRSFS